MFSLEEIFIINEVYLHAGCLNGCYLYDQRVIGIINDVLDYIATKKHTPFLPYQSPDVYMDKFNEFYDVILGTK